VTVPGRFRLVLHKWTLDTTSLSDALRIARETGWDGVELRREDFQAALADAGSAGALLDLLRASGMPLVCLGVELGWMFARGEERRRLLDVFREQCERAAAIGCSIVMSPADRGEGDLRKAADSIREVGDIAARYGVRLGIEPMSQFGRFRRLGHVRELLALANHPHCGLLLDTYHFQRAGDGVRDLEDVRREELVYVQYSDVPSGVLEPGQALNRLPPGQGIVPFKEIFAILAAKGYDGYASYEAPNPAAWARAPGEVAREALAATRAVLPGVSPSAPFP
jgi:4-hydroxyphenylpyruvate dioxygenase